MGRHNIENISIPETCSHIEKDAELLNLRKASNFLYGTVIIYRRQVDRFFKDSKALDFRVKRSIMSIRISSNKYQLYESILNEGKSLQLLDDDPYYDIHVQAFNLDDIFADDGNDERQIQHASHLVATERSSSYDELESSSDIDFGFDQNGNINNLEVISSSPNIVSPNASSILNNETNGELQDLIGTIENLPITPTTMNHSFRERIIPIETPQTAQATVLTQLNPIVRNKMRTSKIIFDPVIEIGLRALKRQREEYLKGKSYLKRNIKKARKGEDIKYKGFLEEFIRRLHWKEQETLLPRIRSSSVSSIERARRNSNASSVEQARRASISSKLSTPEQIRLALQSDVNDEIDKDPLDINIERGDEDDAMLDISLVGDINQTRNLTSSLLDVSRKKKVLEIIGKNVNEKGISMNEVCPYEKTTRSEAVKCFDTILCMASDNEITISTSVCGKRRWDLFNSEEIMLQIK